MKRILVVLALLAVGALLTLWHLLRLDVGRVLDLWVEVGEELADVLEG